MEKRVGVSAEGFALAGDVHLWRGDLDPADYTVPTPDGRPPTREFAGERLARVVCGDRELLDEDAVTALADSLAAAQVAQIAAAVERVRARHPSLRTAVVTGLGAFLGTAAARAAGLEVIALAAELGDAAARCAPAVCVALLLEKTLGTGQAGLKTRLYNRNRSTLGLTVDIVVKIGGSLLSHPRHLNAVLAAVGEASRERRLLVVPGGGPFADTVRHFDRQFSLADDAAHWMAVLGMDQFAHFIVGQLDGAAIAESPREIITALDQGHLPVLAPSVTEIVTHGTTGLVVAPGSATPVVDAMLQLMDSQRRHEMGAAALERVQDEFNWESTAAANLRFFEDVIGSHHD